MSELKRNRRYFIKGEGEATEGVSKKIDQGMDSYMTGKFADESLEKTEKQKADIVWLIEQASYVAELYGAVPYQYKPEHIHILAEEEFKKINAVNEKNFLAFYNKEGIVASEKSLIKNGELNGLILLTHEIFHALSSTKISLVKEGDEHLGINRDYRSGVAYRPINRSDGDKHLRTEFFTGLNEAITQESTRVFYAAIIRKSERFKDLVEEFDKKTGSENWEFPEAARYGIYGWVVWLFLDLCKKIKEKAPDKYKFKNFNDVRDDFFRVYFSGSIKDLKELLDIIDPRCFGDLMDIKEMPDRENLEKIIKFRENFGLKSDPGLQETILEQNKKQDNL